MMTDSGVYLELQRGHVDVIYEATDEEFRDWVGAKIAESGGVFAVCEHLEFDTEMRFDILELMREHDIVVYFMKGKEYARIVKGQERCN